MKYALASILHARKRLATAKENSDTKEKDYQKLLAYVDDSRQRERAAFQAVCRCESRRPRTPVLASQLV